METLSLSEAKIKLSSLIDRVNRLDEEIIITKNGRPAAILVSPDEYEGWKETVFIHSDPGFVKEIKIVALGPRAYIYEETYRLLKKEQ
jgi:prevent-host-death family protein